METQRGEGEKGGLGVSVLTAGLKWNEMNWRNTLDLIEVRSAGVVGKQLPEGSGPVGGAAVTFLQAVCFEEGK